MFCVYMMHARRQQQGGKALRDTLRHDLALGVSGYGRAAAGLHNTHYMTCIHMENL
jgi:hypothetical protein